MITRFVQAVQTSAREYSDVIFSRQCVGCDRLGKVICDNCRSLIPTLAQQRDAHYELWFGAPYESVVREMINAHKDHGVRALTQDLGMVLGRAVWSAAMSSSTTRPIVLVPIPPHATSLQRRGRDTVFEIAMKAARVVSDRGMPCSVAPSLIRIHETQRSAGKSVSERREVHGSFGVRPGKLILSRVIAVDDIVTTGATTNEAVRALQAAGIGVDSIACIASTAARH